MYVVRYVVLMCDAVNELVICFFKTFRIEIKQRDSRRIIAVTSGEQCSVVINVTPFVVDIICDDRLLVTVNSRALLRFNIGRAKSR